MQDRHVLLPSPETTEELGRLLGGLLRQPVVIWLAGELGAGKTCLTRGLARGLEVAEDEPVTSPSYTFMNQYRGRLAIYHFDLYRLGHPGELVDLGFEEYLHGSGVTVVEWADRFPGLISGGMLVELAYRDEDGRSATLKALDTDAEELLRQLAECWPKRGGHL